MSLSLCIATFNEEANIERCVKSVLDFVHQVVIVDGGSTDKTLQILASMGPKIKVIQTTNPAIFHINKQKSIQEATGAWVLSLDADEVVTPQLKAEILQIMANPNARTAYQIPRLNYFLGRFLRKGGVYPDYTIRLFKNSQMFYPCLDVHENVEPIDATLKNGPTSAWLGTCKSPLEHYGDPNFNRYIKRWVRYNKIEALRIQRGTSEHLRGVKNKNLRILTFIILAVVFYPYFWFIKVFFRHKGFMDSWQGFIFHFFSSLRFFGIAWELIRMYS